MDAQRSTCAGCTQATEILAVPGVVLVAPLPPGCDLVTTYTCALAARSTARSEAATLIALLTEGPSREIRGRLGFA